MEFDPGRFETHTHLSLPVPTCERCTVPDPDPDVDIDGVVDSRTGLVTDVENRDGTHGFEGFHLYRAIAADKSRRRFRFSRCRCAS